MAIEIGLKRRVKIPAWSIILGILSLILILILIGSYFYLDSAVKRMTLEIQKREQFLKVGSSEKALQNNLKLIESRIESFADLLSRHYNVGNIFVFLESVCLPKVQFSDFKFDFSKERVVLSGETDNFMMLEQQLHILRQEPLIKKVNLSDVSTNEKGRVDFTFSLVFDPKIFK